MNKIVLLDFCETVIKFHTFNPFVLKMLQAIYPKRYRFIENKFIKYFFVYLSKLLRKFSYNGYIEKNLMIRFLRGISQEVMDGFANEYYFNTLKPNIIDKTIKLIKHYQESGYRIIIVSGASDLYLKYFASDFGINDIVATELCYKNGICTGKINGLDCIDKNKVTKLKEYLRNNNINGELCVCITDSITDKPLLDLCPKKIIISRQKHQQWVTSDMKEIIW